MKNIFNKSQLYICILLLIIVSPVVGQQQFISTGKIEFEKKVNLNKVLDIFEKEDSGGWLSGLRKNMPPSKTYYFDMYFDNNKTLYKPGRADAVVETWRGDWVVGTSTDNVIYSELKERKSISQKTVFEASFVIEDSIRNIKWQLTSDMRNIAGFECRKATGIIMDSVYVFGFYTDQILPCGGPESFTGLPGMILGIAIPRMHTTWFATKLELVNVTQDMLVAPKSKKGKYTTNKAVLDQINVIAKDQDSPAIVGRIKWVTML